MRSSWTNQRTPTPSDLCPYSRPRDGRNCNDVITSQRKPGQPEGERNKNISPLEHSEYSHTDTYILDFAF